MVIGGTGRLAESLPGLLDTLGIAQHRTCRRRRRPYKGLVFDATGLTSADQLRRAARLLHAADAQPGELPARGRARHPARAGRAAPSGSPSGRWRASPAASARRSAAAAPCSSSTSPRAPRPRSPAPWRFLLSPKSAYVSGQVVRVGATGTTDVPEVADWNRPLTARSPWSPAPAAASASRSPGCCTATARPWSGVDVPQAASELVRLMKELDGDHLALDITAKDAPQRIAHHLHDQARRRRRRRAQRGHHPRQEARQHGRGPLGVGDRGQPDRPRADHPRAARPGRRQRPRLDRRRRLDRRHRRQRRPDQLRRLQGRRDRPGRLPRRRAGATASPSTPSRPASSSPR